MPERAVLLVFELSQDRKIKPGVWPGSKCSHAIDMMHLGMTEATLIEAKHVQLAHMLQSQVVP